jgi:outer membrane lipoprotein SlyB
LGALFAVAAVFVLLNGCAAMDTAVRYRTLDVRMDRQGDTIFLEDKLPPQQTRLYVDVTDSSGNGLDLTSSVSQLFAARGYRIVANPKDADLHMRVNIPFFDKSSEEQIQQYRMAGYGGILGGMAAGVGAGALHGSGTGMAVGGLVGGLVGGIGETIANAMVQKGVHALIADVQISQRVANGTVQRRDTGSMRQGSRTVSEEHYASQSNFQRFQTRFSFVATKVNLSKDEATPALIDRFVKTVSGMI